MQRANRLRFVVIAAIACVILFCIAAFSVSWAQWDVEDDDSSVKVQGASDLFYVNYPQYVTNNESGLAIPTLDSGKYYLQVQKDGGVSDYYRMTTNPADSNEVMLTNVYLKAGTVLDMYKGTDKDSIRNRKEGCATEFEHDGGNVPATGKVNKTGYYNFYYQPGYWTMYATYSATLNSNGGGTGNATDMSAYPYNVTFSFSEGSSVKFYFKTDDGADTGCSDIETSYMHIWSPDVNFNIKTKNNQTVALTGKKTETHFMFGFGDDSDWWKNQSSQYLFSAFTESAYLITLQKSNNANIEYKTVVGSTGGSTGTTTTATAAKPTTTGATDFNIADQKPNEKVETVRVMNATMNKKADDRYEYHNYICVSRQNADDSADDNSIAILEFEIKGKGNTSNADLKTIPVSSITLTRRNTDVEGNPLSDYIDPAPRIYNYDLTNPVYLSQIGHGDIHDSFDDVDAQGKNTANMIAHYDDGMYVILYFADNKQQYFALDLSIETTKPAEFTLTASVNNTNMWDRYKKGFGEEWGYYMGGLINEVWMWHPTRTTKFEVDTGSVKFDKDKELEALGISDWTDWKDLTDAQRSKKINDFNNNSNFNYNIIDYSEKGTVTDNDGNPMWARYTQDYVDITLTINLTGGSKVKLCMLDWSGERGDIGNGVMRPTTYYLPNKIISYPDDLFDGAATYDKDLNFVIPASGEYSFRYVGYVHNYVGKWMSKADGTILNNDDGNSKQIDAYNFVIDELYISKADVVGEMITVTFDPDSAGGGYFDDGDATKQQLVRFGNMVKTDLIPEPKTTAIDKRFGGWYYQKTVNVNGVNTVVNVDYDGDPIIDDMRLIAKWVGMEYEITFALKGGTWKSNAPTGGKLKTGDDGRIAADRIPEAEKDGYTFVHWLDGDGKAITQAELENHVFSKKTTLTAVWEENGYSVTFNPNGMPITEPTAQSVKHGETAIEPTISAPAHYTFVGWYENAAGTGSAFDFVNTSIIADKELFAKWTADDGVYVDGVYVGEISANTDKPEVTSTRLKALGVLLKAGETAKFLYNNKYITSALYIRNNSPAVGNITPAYATGTKNINNANGLTASVGGWYDMYYEDTNGNGTEGGIWLILAHAYEESNFNEATDGLYNGNDKLEAFTVNDEASYELTATVTLAASTTISIKYNNTVQTTVTPKDGSLGTFSGGKVTLGAGTYTFYYDYIAKTLYIEGKYLITFDANNGAWADGDTTKTALTGKLESGKATIDANDVPDDPARGDNYTFAGWYTAASGGTKVDNVSAYEFSSTTTHTLYAQWKDKTTSYTITFDPNGGECATASADTVNGKLTSLPAATKDLHEFDGWYTSDGTKVTATTEFTSSQTVTARWTANKFRIVLDVSGWSGTTGYSYHIHAWKDGGDTVTGTGSDRWNTRNELTRIAGTNEYYIDFDSSATIITDIIFTQDNTGTRTEHARKTFKTSTISSNGKFELGKTYTVETIEVKETAGAIGSSGVWLVGEGLSNGGWDKGIEIPDGGAVIVHITNTSGWMKIRTDGSNDGSGTNNCEGDLTQNNGNFYVSSAGYYKFTWNGSKVKAEYIGTSL